jgi:hypothetical protein
MILRPSIERESRHLAYGLLLASAGSAVSIAFLPEGTRIMAWAILVLSLLGSIHYFRLARK